MREYKIKRGYYQDINNLISSYYGVKGDIKKGVDFETEGIGKVHLKQEKSLLIVDIVPPKTVLGDYSVIKKWNKFLFEATGKDTKERKKDFGKKKQ